MATTDTQQTAQLAAQAAVSAAEAKQYLLSIQQPVIDISESVADAQNAAAAAEMARDQAQGISTELVQTIDSQLSAQEIQFENQMTDQQSSFDLSQTERDSSFEEKSNEFESRFSLQLSTQESTFSESQTEKEDLFQQFLLDSGYVFLGNYENGPFQFGARNQYIQYNNQYYRLNAATDVGFTTTGTSATTFANDVTHFVLMDGDTLRQNMGASDGFSLIGQATYAQIRSYTGAGNSIMCSGAETSLDGAQGIFRYDPSDTTTSDNDCTVIVDTLGRRWKREFTGDIRAEWANMKTTDETSAAQDTAFSNCILAAAAASDTGYPQRIIRLPERGTVKLSQKHNIRCGVFSESDDYSPVSNLGGKFGLIGKLCFDGDGEILIVQANSPYIEVEIDNGGLTYTTAPTSSSIGIRLEAMVMNAHIDIKGYNYPGCVLYSTGKDAVSDISAIWPDLNTPLPSIQNVAHFAMRTNKCGQGFYLQNTGSGFGHMDSVWEQLNTNASVLKAMYDVTVKSYEDFVAPLTLSGGLIIDTCGTITVDNLLIGSGGGPHVRIWDTPAITIKRIFSVNGGPTYAQTVAGQYALEICNSRVGIGLIDAYYPGEFIRTGYNAFVGIGHINGWYMCRVTRQVNDIAYLQYRGSRVGQINDVSEVIIDKGIFYNLNYYAGGYPAQSLFYVDPSVPGGELTLNNIKFRNTHSGWTGTTEAQTYIVEVKTTSNTFLFNSRNTKWDDNNFNYVVYLSKEYQLGDFQSTQTNFARIRYADGNQSTFGMRDSPHPDLGTTTPATDGSNWTYNYRRPGKYNGLLTVGASSTVTVAVNGQTVFYANSAGTYPLNLKLYFQEIVTITFTGSVTLGSSTWRYTV